MLELRFVMSREEEDEDERENCEEEEEEEERKRVGGIPQQCIRAMMTQQYRQQSRC